MTNLLAIRRNQLIGVTKRYLRRGCAWKKKAIEPARWRRSIKFLRTSHGPVSAESCSGITRPDSTQRDCWRKIRSGNLLSRSMTSSLQQEAAEARKQKRV